MSSVASKKRKRNEDISEVSLSLSTQDVAQIGPVLASFPALQPTKSIPYRCYESKKEPNKPFAEQDTIIVGETESVEFVSGSESRSAAAGCSYLVGIHDKRTNTTVFRPAPLHVLTRTVKKLKNLESIVSNNDARLAQRNKLGETFGTKKAKAAIRAQERNRIDIDAMSGTTGHLQTRIGENTVNLPTREEMKAAADEARPIPPYDADAERPDDVYALHDIIPESEFNAISVQAITKASSDKERQQLLPYSRSEWVNYHLRLVFAGSKPNKKTLKILYYVSVMLAFKQFSRSLEKDKLPERLKTVPSIVIDGLFSRFTETARESTQSKMTSQTETSLMTHMFALCLRVDDFATDYALLAGDLKMESRQVGDLFKSLGCHLGTLTQGDLTRLGLPSTAAQTKRAILSTPLHFPEVRQKRMRR
ncbi:DNA-directed RNA polymerase I subunit rpa49 [Steccherinum ochraceum]|uniref:DNA-directed RNA polymerase I subunit rpa49 n=1 Tax=Steccherinum ochraceum TaxID=92696 RepID=A0A4R0RJ27_9APHY|nr:DNA-directed RNA polymerase I subunit rpa49 [Steccherinum ochraceum]